LAVYSVLLFLSHFPNETIFNKSRILKAHSISTALILILTLTPYFVTAVVKRSQGVSISTSPLYYLFLIYVFISLILLARVILKQHRAAHIPIEKNQTKLISIGIILYAIFAVSANVILPALVDNWYSSRFGPAFTLFFTSLTAYTIFKHKLFDIKGVVVRAAAYFFAFSVLALLYVIPAIVLAGTVLDAPISTPTYFVLVVITLITSLLFQPLRLSFNKLTARFFYRDYYEPQDVLDKISRLLVGSVDLGQIETESTEILKSSVKPVKLRYLLTASKDGEAKLLELLESAKKDILVADDLTDGRHVQLSEIMRAEDLALAIRLRTKHEVLGFMLFGYKQSGAGYSAADLKLLSIVADEIAVGLQNALRFEEIRRFNATLEQKVEDATKKLRHANTRLKELDATKDEFISMASHQLRTPLTTIKGYLSMILEGDMGKVKKEQEEMIQQAFDSAQRMVYLIADLLNVSRLQTGKFVIDNHPTNLAEVVEGEVKQLHEQALARKIMLAFKKPSDTPVLNLDETKIRQVVMNFLDNALYYTPTGGSVSVELKTTADSVTYAVTDTGVGVPKDVQHHLFSKFYRADNARKMRPDGTGLGLYMAKKVIVAQGGAIIFKSVEGQGSTFGFSFPRSKTEIKK
jgi:signal transduction histidine kinase